MAGEDDDVGLDPNGSPGSESPEPGQQEHGADDTELPPEHVGDAADNGEPEDEVDVQPERPSRGETRFQRLANEAKAAREEAAEARREAQELRRAQAQQNYQLTEQQERERLALMTPEERAEYRITKFERESHVREQQREFRSQNAIDKATYDTKATLNPVYKRYQEEVEERFDKLLREGKATEREVILKFILGERALNGAAGSSKKAKASGERRIEAQRVSGGNAKGDTRSQRGKTGDTPENRLKDVFI